MVIFRCLHSLVKWMDWTLEMFCPVTEAQIIHIPCIYTTLIHKNTWISQQLRYKRLSWTSWYFKESLLLHNIMDTWSSPKYVHCMSCDGWQQGRLILLRANPRFRHYYVNIFVKLLIEYSQFIQLTTVWSKQQWGKCVADPHFELQYFLSLVSNIFVSR